MPDQQNQNTKPPLRVLLSAGEASGEMYGAELIAALRELTGNAALPAAGARDGAVECFGLGGERMRAAGCELVVDARDVAVVGLAEVLSHLPGIYQQFHKLLAEVDRRKPDVAVLIDFPDWNLRLAKQLHRRGIPVVYYISPQLWAWRKGRIKQVQRYVSEMLVIIPFERDYYAQHGVQVEFVGHPLSELDPPTVTREEFGTQWGLDSARQWIALLPGSRRKELRMNLPAMLEAAGRLGPQFEFVMPVASTLDRDWVAQEIAACHSRLLAMNKPRQSANATKTIFPEVKLTGDARATLLHARAAVVASGTATMEAALIGTPFVMVYRVSNLTWALGRHLVKLPYFGMVNLIAGHEVVPELIQERFTPAAVECHLRVLIEEGPARQRQLEAFAELRRVLRRELLQGDRVDTAALRAARAVLRVAERS